MIEFGASWPRWLDPSQVGTLAVVAQHYAGPPDSLITQVRSRVARLASTGWTLTNVVLVSSGRLALESQAARSLLTHQLLTCVRDSPGARLTFTLSSDGDFKAQKSLCALAAKLDRAALASGIELGVCLADGSSIYSRPALASLASAG